MNHRGQMQKLPKPRPLRAGGVMFQFEMTVFEPLYLMNMKLCPATEDKLVSLCVQKRDVSQRNLAVAAWQFWRSVVAIRLALKIHKNHLRCTTFNMMDVSPTP